MEKTASEWLANLDMSSLDTGTPAGEDPFAEDVCGLTRWAIAASRNPNFLVLLQTTVRDECGKETVLTHEGGLWCLRLDGPHSLGDCGTLTSFASGFTACAKLFGRG